MKHKHNEMHMKESGVVYVTKNSMMRKYLVIIDCDRSLHKYMYCKYPYFCIVLSILILMFRF